jgi:MFS family permease
MWELYAFWAWIPGFLAAARTAHHASPQAARVWGGAVIALGGVGAIWAGLVADRVGRARVARRALLVSGACCLISPLLFTLPLGAMLLIAAVWGVAVIADSAQFSAMVTEFAPPHAVGTALGLQTSLGFLLSIATIQLVPILAGAIGWQWAMVVLVLGPAAALRALRGL